jgi:hypothetical protein
MNSHHNKIELQKDESSKIKFECAFRNQKLELLVAWKLKKAWQFKK